MNDELNDFWKEQAILDDKAELYAKEQGLTLKGIKYFAAGSQETNCFVAAIYKGAEKIGDANNDGHGGDTFVQVNGLTEHALLERWVDNKIDKYLQVKEELRTQRWAAKQVANNKAKGYTVVCRRGNTVSVHPTKAKTLDAAITADPKIATAEKIEFYGDQLGGTKLTY